MTSSSLWLILTGESPDAIPFPVEMISHLRFWKVNLKNFDVIELPSVILLLRTLIPLDLPASQHLEHNLRGCRPWSLHCLRPSRPSRGRMSRDHPPPVKNLSVPAAHLVDHQQFTLKITCKDVKYILPRAYLLALTGALYSTMSHCWSQPQVLRFNLDQSHGNTVIVEDHLKYHWLHDSFVISVLITLAVLVRSNKSSLRRHAPMQYALW